MASEAWLVVFLGPSPYEDLQEVQKSGEGRGHATLEVRGTERKPLRLERRE